MGSLPLMLVGGGSGSVTASDMVAKAGSSMRLMALAATVGVAVTHGGNLFPLLVGTDWGS